MGVQALIYYMLTTIIAVFTGITLVIALQPGKRGRTSQVLSGGGFNESLPTTDAFLDLIRSANPSITGLDCSVCVDGQQSELYKHILQVLNLDGL